MGKKGKVSSNKKYVSKGERISSIKTSSTNSADRILNKTHALENGKDVWFTFKNPNQYETNKPYIKKKIYAKEWLSGKRSPTFT